MTIYSHDYMKKVLADAHDGRYALPAINISNLDTAIAAMDGLQVAGSPGFVQVSIGAAEQASPDGDPVKGSLILGRMLAELRKQYDVPIFIHTDHCHVQNVDRWLRPLLVELKRLKDESGERIFDSFMFDGSMAEIHENAKIIDELVPLVKAVDGFIEVEAGGAWGGSEDGVGGGAKYSTPEDVKVIQNAMHANGYDDGDYLLAVAFGNAHGTAVVPNLKPELLHEIAVNTNADNLFVFHGGSGSPDGDVEAAVANGVVKMNVDTDTQYAFTQGVAYFLESAPMVEDGNDEDGDGHPVIIAYKSHEHGKQWFDPRHWNHAGRASMSAHVGDVAKLLGSIGHA